MIIAMGFDDFRFSYIFFNFELMYECYLPYSDDEYLRKLPTHNIQRGRPRSMTVLQLSGLMLAWGR